MTYQSNVLLPRSDGRSTPIFQTTRRHVPGERNLDIHSLESLNLTKSENTEGGQMAPCCTRRPWSVQGASSPGASSRMLSD